MCNHISLLYNSLNLFHLQVECFPYFIHIPFYWLNEKTCTHMHGIGLTDCSFAPEINWHLLHWDTVLRVFCQHNLVKCIMQITGIGHLWGPYIVAVVFNVHCKLGDMYNMHWEPHISGVAPVVDIASSLQWGGSKQFRVLSITGGE